MPVIRQERGVRTIAGLPDRWGRRAYQELKQALAGNQGEYKALAGLLDAITAAPIPVDATDAHLCVLAERYASDCASVPLAEAQEAARIGADVPWKSQRERMAQICCLRGIEPPEGKDGEAMRRMTDAAWWRRNLRRVHGRAFEHAAMRLGFVSIRAGSYCSDETVKRRMAQIQRNTAALKAAMVRNEQGQEFSLYDLAAKGMGNKTLRKQELMTRMAGCEDIATELGHVGLFVTLTAPSRFHPVLSKTGQINPKYNGATPRETQGYLNTVWARTRAQNARDGLTPYGFRIAEPHHDGCPHWHMLLFMPRAQVDTFKANLDAYGLAMDGTEAGASANRIKYVEIDPSKGTAAGYIAKYVGKNIDDSQGAAFDEEGAVDLTGDSLTTPCQRVDAWASVWGIRQFQGLGMPPVTVWRELRRVKEQADEAPEYVRRALTASRRIEGIGPTMDGKPLVMQGADFGEYIRAQGGVNRGRRYLVRVVHEVELVEGRYGQVERQTPMGVYGVTEPATVCRSTRYRWQRAARTARGVPWSPLNNCTDEPEREPFWWPGDPVEIPEFDDSGWFESVEFAAVWMEPGEVVGVLEAAAHAAWAARAANW